MKTSLILPGGLFKSIKTYLFDGSRNEFCCYLFCGAVRSRRGRRLIARSCSFPDKETDYRISHGTACKPTDHYMDNVLYEKPKENDLIRKNLSIVDIHCHPFSGDGTVGFSHDDDHWQQESSHYFFKIRNLEGFYCFIVMGKNSFDGRICHWDKAKDRPVWNSLSEVIILDYPYRKWQNPSNPGKKLLSRNQHKVFDRQIRAFGSEGQELMADLTVGVVGVGGTGSIAAEGLSRLGVNRFILVDHDKAEITNLNRLQGMTMIDAQTNPYKTLISARQILSINPSAWVQPVNLPVQDKKAINQLKVCDFILLTTDNLMSRAFINEFCLQYGIPMFSVGTVINTFTGTDNVQDIFGEYFAMIPGNTTCCLKCAGLVDYGQVSYLLSAGDVIEEGRKRGYIDDDTITQPAVRPLNGAMTEIMLSEVHNYFCGFKGRLEEGLGYDQKRNLLHRRFYLNPFLDTQTDGVVIEGRVTDKGCVEILVNGIGPWEINLDQKNLIIETLEAPAEMGLNKSGKRVVENYLYNLKDAADRKKRCTLCCSKGKLGLGDNEPMTPYPVPESS